MHFIEGLEAKRGLQGVVFSPFEHKRFGNIAEKQSKVSQEHALQIIPVKCQSRSGNHDQNLPIQMAATLEISICWKSQNANEKRATFNEQLKTFSIERGNLKVLVPANTSQGRAH